MASTNANSNICTDRQMLTDFRYSILFLLGGEPDYGLGIKERLQEYYGNEINHGQVYSNLNWLHEDGFLLKSPLDNRTNAYQLSEHGVALALDRVQWAISNLCTDEDLVADVINRIDEAVLNP